VRERDAADRHERVEIAQERGLQRQLVPDGHEDRDAVPAEDVVGQLEGAALAERCPDENHRLRLPQQLEPHIAKALGRERTARIALELRAERLTVLSLFGQHIQPVPSAADVAQHIEHALNHH
jgi:hypothetical protein